MPARSPLEDWANEAKYNKASYFFPHDYISCWHAALARLSVALNSTYRDALPTELLRSDDDEVLDHFRDLNNPYQYYSLNISIIEEGLTNKAIEEADVATNFFYGAFEPQPNRKRLRLIYNLPRAFLNYSYEGLHRPWRSRNDVYSLVDLGCTENDPTNLIMKECAANYLVRNFWHNIVHNLYQNINSSNYRHFRGGARYASDFEADNLSLILLAYCYGLPVRADRYEPTNPLQKNIHLLRKNKCNELFRLRAGARREIQSFEDTEWRITRTVAGYLSGWLVAQGLATAHLTVHCIGAMKNARGQIKRDGDGFGICLNGFRVAYPHPYPINKSAAERSAYLREMATVVQNEYRRGLRQDKKLLQFARASLDNVFARLGLSR